MDMSAANVDPALVVRRRALRRTEGRRRLAVLVGAVAMLLLPGGYWGLEHSPIFSVSHVTVTGASPRVDAQVQALVSADVAGKSLLQVDASGLAAKLEALPDVRLARVDRAFPHGVDVSVVMERAAAFVRAGASRYVISADGRVLRSVTRPPAHLPRIVLPTGAIVVTGHTVTSTSMQAALSVLSGVPARFERGIGARLKGVVSSPGGVVAVFGHGLQVQLGSPGGLGLKLRVAAKVLTEMGASIRRSVAYVNVSVPARPTVGYKK
jgi:cell division protein FtsQ